MIAAAIHGGVSGGDEDAQIKPPCLLIANYYRSGKLKFMFHDNFAIILILPTATDRPYCMVENAVGAAGRILFDNDWPGGRSEGFAGMDKL